MSKGGLVTEQQSNFGIHIDEPNVASNGTVTQNIIIGDKDILSFSLETNEQAGSSALIFERDSRSDGHCFDSLSYQYKCKLLNVPYTNHPNTDWVFNNRLDISSSTFDIIFESSSPQVGQHAISVFAENDLIDTDKSSLNLYVGSTTIDGIASTAGISIQVDDKAEDKQAKLTFMQANGENDIINVTLDQLALKSDIPSGIDLTNYQGDWKLTKQITTSASSVTFQSLTHIADISNTENLESQSLFAHSKSYIAKYLGTIVAGAYCDLGNGTTSFIGNSQAGSTIIVDSNDDNHSYSDVYISQYGGRVISCERYIGDDEIPHRTDIETSHGGFRVSTVDKNNNECALGIYTDKLGTGNSVGIWFKDFTIDPTNHISLKSLVDRITALEQALAEKANTANPAFTGKVSINSES